MHVRDAHGLAIERVQWIYLMVIAVAVVLIARLYEVQLIDGQKYADSLRSQTTVAMILPPARGGIYDRNGLALAENVASFDIDIYMRELVGHYARSQHGRLPYVMQEDSRGRARRLVDTAKIVRETTTDLLKSLRLEPSYTDREIRNHYNQKPNIAFQLVRGMDFETLSRIAERGTRIPGIQETARPIRKYNYGALAAHILGYVGAVQEETDEEYQPEFVGKTGIERTFDEYLQGEPGGKILRKNNLGYILGEEALRAPKAGQMIYLTIDARIQWIAEQAMRKVGRGAAVVMDPNTGDILAMVSVPSFDPNAFVPKIDANTWNRWTKDPTRPMFNRAISGYAAGSIYKTFVAMAALENKNLNPRFTANTVIDSPGAVWLANRWWRDWSPGGQGMITLRRAMAMSCNTFFYQLGVRTGIQSIVDIGNQLGLGKKLLDHDGMTVLHGESAGVLPGPEWMKNIMDRRLERWREQRKTSGNKKLPRPSIEVWSDGHTINTAIGQGYVQVSPLQMTVAMAAIANGGTVYYPRLVQGVARSTAEGMVPVREFPVRKKGDVQLDPKNMEVVRDCLVAVVEEGTGRRAAVQGVRVAGKTGTAQFETVINGRRTKDLRTWFNGFAPYESPRYAITVLVEGGTSGGSTSGPIVSEILTQIFAMEQGQEVPMSYLEPAVGHFSGVQEITASSVAAGAFDAPPSEDAGRPTFSGRGRIRNVRGLR